MTKPPATARAMARQIIQLAMDDLRLESLRAGRADLFAALYPALIDPFRKADQSDGSAYTDMEIQLALLRLRERLRERVNARLRALEPDAERRRALRRQLQVIEIEPGDAT